MVSYWISSGFEHVFVGEKTGTTVGGQHNWIRTYMLEKAGSINYKGYIDHKAFQPTGNSTVGHNFTLGWTSMILHVYKNFAKASKYVSRNLTNQRV